MRKEKPAHLRHVLDVVFDALTLGGDGRPVDALVLDVSDAFGHYHSVLGSVDTS